MQMFPNLQVLYNDVHETAKDVAHNVVTGTEVAVRPAMMLFGGFPCTDAPPPQSLLCLLSAVPLWLVVLYCFKRTSHDEDLLCGNALLRDGNLGQGSTPTPCCRRVVPASSATP